MRLLAHLDRLAVMGLAEVAVRAPFFLALRRRIRDFLAARPVDLLVPIDYPGFNLPLARYANRRGIPVVYYVAPQVWAWRPGRVRQLADHTRRVCAILPFEEDVLTRAGVPARFVGHPLLDEPGPPGASSAGPSGGAPDADAAPCLGLFPGSRSHEVTRLLGPFARAARRLRREIPGLRVLVARPDHLAAERYEAAGEWPVVPAGEAASRATAALTKSGTITLELALAETPMVVAHRLHPLTWEVARRAVRVEHVSLVNLVAGRGVVPELLQGRAAARALAEKVRPLLDSGGSERADVVRGLRRVRKQLGRPGVASRVAGHCVEAMRDRGGRR